MACSYSAPRPARACFVAEGARDRYKEVDTVAHGLAVKHAAVVEGNAPTIVLKMSQQEGMIVVHTPFATYPSLLALHGPMSTELNLLFDDLLMGIHSIGLQVTPCEKIEGLRTPVLYGAD